MNGVCVLGSTGSIGVSTLEVIRLNRQSYSVVALTANKNIERLFEQCIEFKPVYAVVPEHDLAETFRKKIEQSDASETKVLSGIEALEYVVQLAEVDTVVAAIVGAAGLLSTLAAAKSGKKLLLANKESLVISGDLLMTAVKESGATLLPLDSEHNALFQCMPDAYQSGQRAEGIRKLILTASGGPFLKMSLSELDNVTVEQACAHPNWSMGRKISVDSATMMNKGLEVIEASYLFDVPSSLIEVLVHPQSIIHSMVDYLDGSVLAQLGNPDMRTPIAHALAWPKRQDSGVSPLDLIINHQLTFEAPSFEKFPCLKLAYEALNKKGTAPAILNAANEVAVDAFLSKKLRFTAISTLIEKVMAASTVRSADSIETVLKADEETRVLARHYLEAS
ncbi:MAG: 1-deoxy-D-xylulose-5-phosphate reductoisomerase [Cycloclasticus sp.]|nr:MAG: 1-deoxy-D-xylulose 5-phosphate reductoisomerase [Colwellia sp. Phe_37]MBV1913502.1 1-deoxy-D-xylulose-5-phosphate reductoisomerase [Cycloclasticus sp.]MDF1688746.1 1-deoxy-D-xylulose-5-phosphate reductoisomerase [Cycloclasticus sp.]